MLQDYLLSSVSPFSPPRDTRSFSTSALQMVNPKSSLITIGWMRNWFHSWMSRSWIGNYDILLTTSSISKQFFDTFQGAFPVLCYRHCPSPLQLIQQRRSTTGDLLRSSISLIPFLFSVKILRIATNPMKFTLKESSSLSASTSPLYDFIFTGNYWNVPREIMEFNASQLSTFRGAIIGNGWQVGNPSL